jgi:hypothetical protein
MKYLKKYKIFESLNNIHFPTENEIKELFIELYDDEILFQNIRNFTYGYVFFPYNSFFGQLLQQFTYDVEKFPDWENLRPYILQMHKIRSGMHGDSWSDLFLDVNDERNHYMLEKCQDWIFIDQKDISQTTKLIWENIENGKILAYPVIKFYLGYFETKNKELVFEALERYNITPHMVEFRHKNFWDGGLHCITSDLHRKGPQQDYKIFSSFDTQGPT